jgi:hypothetical protein
MMPLIRNGFCGGFVLSSCEVVSKGLSKMEETIMGRGILLWLLGVPIPIIILLALIWH